MYADRDEDGWIGWRAIPRVVLGVLTLPVVAGFVALGVVVVAGRSLRDVAREALMRREPLSAGGPLGHRHAA